MAQLIEVKVPDIGDFKNVEVIEVLVKPGDTVKKEDSLVSLESDKASMEIPSSHTGVVTELKVKVGDKVSQGSVVLLLEASAVIPADPPPRPASSQGDAKKSVPAVASQPTNSATSFTGDADITCDMVVLGAGPGGYSAAFRAADLGMNTVLIERYATLGGVCLNVGCIPSKALLHVAAVMDEASALSAHGISFGQPVVDMKKLLDWKHKVVGKLTGGLSGMAKARKVTVLTGVGAFLSPNHMAVTASDGAKKIVRFDNIMLNTKTVGAQAKKDGIYIQFEGEQAPATPQRYDMVLVAVGRAPNGGKIGADKAGVAVTERGFIAVDSQMRSNVSHIFAIGDVIGNPMLAHKAVHQGHVAAEAAAGEKSHFDARVIPSVAYTDPEIAWAGETEDSARDKGLKIGKAIFPWAASGRAIANGRDEGFTKLLFDASTQRIVGGAIVGKHAGDLISEIALAIEMGCDALDIGKTIHPHPTLGESVGMAAELFEGVCTDLPPQKRR